MSDAGDNRKMNLIKPPAPLTEAGRTRETTGGLFISDLHLFSQRSIGQAYWNQNKDRILAAKTIVLGGDIFDLRWSQLGSLNATIDAANAWIEAAIASNPRASWVYLLGNHDCHPRIAAILESLAGQHQNFAWSSTVWKIGKSVFLHGDVLDGERHTGGLDAYRKSFHEDRQKGRIGNLLYSAVIETRLHGLVPRLRHAQKKTCRRLICYLERQSEGFLDDIDSIYFGHTHIPMDGFRYSRFRFYNAGSGIRHLKLIPTEFEVT